MGGGAWLFLVGGVICLVNSDNERDLNLLGLWAVHVSKGPPPCGSTQAMHIQHSQVPLVTGRQGILMLELVISLDQGIGSHSDAVLILILV
ncbi:hypothetical protein BKA82DRAFT_4174935 [Pisolithus tinctorius]|nr:hypothetical protein BKA82DRAFT_4174935 [Pisolithus tinctorius]